MLRSYRIQKAMLARKRFTAAELAAATGYKLAEVEDLIARMGVERLPPEPAGAGRLTTFELSPQAREWIDSRVRILAEPSPLPPWQDDGAETSAAP